MVLLVNNSKSVGSKKTASFRDLVASTSGRTAPDGDESVTSVMRQESSSSVSSPGCDTFSLHRRRRLNHNRDDVAAGDDDDESRIKSAKQRASVTWLLRKAFKNKVPEELADPYYKDHKDQEWLKPQVVRDLANASYYCMTLANIYSSPNFTQLNHWGVIQALNRKGVYVGQPGDVALTETVLIQTNPIKMSAHMAMIEALMSLFVKEVLGGGRVAAAVNRIHPPSASGNSSALKSSSGSSSQGQEESLLLWVNASCAKLSSEIEARLESRPPSDDDELDSLKAPRFPTARELTDLSDGVALGGLVGLYCPDDADWSEVRCPDSSRSTNINMSEATKNLQIVADVCRNSLTHDPLCMSVDDFLYMNSSLRQNVLAFLADLFFLLEVEPARCVRLPGTKYEKIRDPRSSPRRGGVSAFTPKLNFQQNMSPIPDLRPSLDQPGTANKPAFVSAAGERSGSGRRSRFNSGNSTNGGDSNDFFQRQSSGRSSLKDRQKGYSDHGQEQYDSGRSSSSRGKYGVDDSGTDEEARSVRRYAGGTNSAVDDRNSNANANANTNANDEDDPSNFVVHKRKAIPTLAQRISKLHSAATGAGQGADDSVQGALEDRPAGKPSDRPAGSVTPATGRRSRRNSFSEESQLTWENFGGSTDNLHLLHRNPDKDLVMSSGKAAAEARDARAQAAAIRRKNSDLQSTIELGDGLPDDEEDAYNRRRRAGGAGGRLSRSASQERGPSSVASALSSDEPPPLRHSSSHSPSPARVVRGISDDPSETADSVEVEADLDVDEGRTTSHPVAPPSPSTSSVVMRSHVRDYTANPRPISFAELSSYSSSPTSTAMASSSGQGININFMRQTAGASSPNRKRPQITRKTPQQAVPGSPTSSTAPNVAHSSAVNMAAEISSLRMQLEEKKRRIEAEKRKMEATLAYQKQRVGQQAFMHALHKDPNEQGMPMHHPHQPNWSMNRHSAIEPDAESYQQSLAMMNSLADLQEDIQRLSIQQQELTKLMQHQQNQLQQSQMQQQQSHMQQQQSQMQQQQQMQHHQQMQSPQMQSPFYLQNGFSHQTSPSGRRQWGGPVSMDHHSAPLVQQPTTPRRTWGPPQQPQNLIHQLQQQQQQHQPGPHSYMQSAPTSLNMGGPAPWSGYQGGYQQPHQQQQQQVAYAPPGVLVQQPVAQSPFRLHHSTSTPEANLVGSGRRDRTLGNPSSGTGPSQPGGYGATSPSPTAPVPPATSTTTWNRRSKSPAVNNAATPEPASSPHMLHSAVPAPSVDDMAPQSISFIGSSPGGADDDDVDNAGYSSGSGRSGSRTWNKKDALTRKSPAPSLSLSISPSPSSGPRSIQDGSKTYRIHHPEALGLPSPVTTPTATTPGSPGGIKVPRKIDLRADKENKKQGKPVEEPEPEAPELIAEPLKDGKADLGFYISFDDESPKRGKPPHLRNAAAAAQLPTKKEAGITLDRLMASTNAGMGRMDDEDDDVIGGGDGDAGRFGSSDRKSAPLSIKNLRAAEVNPSTASLGRVKPAVPPKSKFLSNVSSSSSPSTNLRRTNLTSNNASGHDDPKSSFLNRHRALSPQSSSDVSSSNADVDSNAPIEEMYALARKYEKMADPDFLRRCEADSEGLASNHGDGIDDDVGGWASPRSGEGGGMVVGDEPARADPETAEEMERKKEKFLLQSLKRKAEQEESKRRREAEMQAKRELENQKEEEKMRKKEEEKARRQAILESYRLKKAMEKAEEEGRPYDMPEGMKAPVMRNKAGAKPRPKSMHEAAMSRKSAAQNAVEYTVSGRIPAARGRRMGSSQDISGSTPAPRRDSLRKSAGNLASGMAPSPSDGTTAIRRSDSLRRTYRIQRGSDRRKTISGLTRNISPIRGSDQDASGYTDSGLGRSTPPRVRGLTPPSHGGGPPSLPYMGRRRRNFGGDFDDGASDASSIASCDYNGPRLYKQPTAKSNRSIILNAVNYCVFPGAVNAAHKARVLEEIDHSDSKHFLILFRDAGCQFRGLYSYDPDADQVHKLFGKGPAQIAAKMFDRFFKYNSGGKVFTQIHTKHLTVTIDAFTIHDALWTGRKTPIPNKRDMALVV